MKAWKQVKFKDILENGSISYGIVQPGSHQNINSVPILRVNNLSQNRIDLSNVLKVAKEIEEGYLRTRLEGGELLITIVGSVGICAIAPKELKGWNVARAIAVGKIKNDYDINFIKYQFYSDDIKFQIYGNINDTVQPTLNLSSLKELSFFLPPLREQRAIAAVLSNLDDKIDLLQRQNATLEAMAEALFKQWFVVEAKEEWEERTIGEMVEVKGGSTPRTKNLAYWNGDIPWTSPRDLTGKNDVFLLSTERSISEAGLAQISSGLLPRGTLLLSSRAPIGYLAITDIELAINQGYIAILNNSYISNYYMYLWCKYNMDEIKAAGNGSVFQEISKSVFRQLPFLLPSKNTLSDFNGMIEPYFQKIHSNQIQIQTLEKLRDTLLPKLMSGEVRVSLD